MEREYESSMRTKILKLLLIIFIITFAALPIYATAIVSVTPYSNMLEPMLYPKYFEPSNYAFSFSIVWQKMLNSFFYASCAVIFDLAIAIPVSYVLARFKFFGRNMIMFSLLFTQMLAGIILMPSIYSIFTKFGWTNTRFGVILVYVGVNLALSIWLLVGFMKSVPVEVEEAAIIDGTGALRLLYGVVVPMLRPGIAVAAIFIFINTYNEFVIPIFLLTDVKLQTVTQILNSLLTATTVEWPIVASSSIIGMLPPLLVFLFFQKDIISGGAAGAVKG